MLRDELLLKYIVSLRCSPLELNAGLFLTTDKQQDCFYTVIFFYLSKRSEYFFHLWVTKKQTHFITSQASKILLSKSTQSQLHAEKVSAVKVQKYYQPNVVKSTGCAAKCLVWLMSDSIWQWVTGDAQLSSHVLSLNIKTSWNKYS